VSSITSFANGTNIGIELSDSTVQWTTVSGAPAGHTITLATTLTASVASGAQVYGYETANRLTRPLRILSGYIYNVVGPSRYPINVITRDQYFSLGGPTQANIPNQIYYDPQLGTGQLYVYPQFSTGDNLLQITYHKEFDDFNASSDTPDFPQEFYLPLTLGLASLLGPDYGLPINERDSLMKTAEFYRDMALSNGAETGSLFIGPDWRWTFANK